MSIELTGEYHTDVNLCLGRIDELKAHVERLRRAIVDCGMYIDDDHNREVLNKLLRETPSQSISHVRAQAIEEYQNAIKVGMYFIDSNVLDIGDDLISKYKEQSDE